MFNPYVRRKRSGVPVLSRNEIDEIGEGLVRDFNPLALITPQEIDIDLFVQDYLGMQQDFQYLSHCGVYLGMTVFNDTDKLPVYNPQTNAAEYISEKARTVIIDNSLLSTNQEHRYRFTMGHEAGHGFLHNEYFSYDPNQLTLFGMNDGAFDVPMIQCRVDAVKLCSTKRSWSDMDWMEWQANAVSSAILMPKSMVIKAVEEVIEKKRNNDLLPYAKIFKVSSLFNVSFEAAEYRLKELKLFEHNYKINKAIMDFYPIFEV